MSLGWKKRYIKLVENVKFSTYDRPFFSIEADEELRIENHGGIVEYSSEILIVKTYNFFVKISGDNLIIESITSEDINITGKIRKVEFDEA